MSFTPRIGLSAAFHIRWQSTDSLLRMRQDVLSDTLVKAIQASTAPATLHALADEMAKVRNLQKNLFTLETTRASLENDVATLDRQISHKAWIYPTEPVHVDLAKKAKKEAELEAINRKLAQIYSVNTKH